ncbi:hypothetical protein IMZ48_44675 [Candidatus Bathyarchaeota archaeon]|nr:hypothetical protein [Candidatus Bathyarchaeota archaeon]
MLPHVSRPWFRLAGDSNNQHSSLVVLGFRLAGDSTDHPEHCEGGQHRRVDLHGANTSNTSSPL